MTPLPPLDRYRALLPAAEFAALLAALERPLPQALRLNPLKVEPGTAMAALAARYGWQAQPVPFCAQGWQVAEAATPLSATLEFRLGQYYIQDAASMLPAELFDWAALPDAPLALDLAAAPGGKSTHLSAKMSDRGLLLANDTSAGRIPALRGVLRDWGAASVAVTNFPGERFGAWFAGQFDLALLDAPCSMENLRESSSHGRKGTSARERGELASRQLRLLESALQAVRVGGQVVYSTCTLAPEEDEGVLDALLRRYPGALQIEQALDGQAPGLAADEERAFLPGVTLAARLWPHSFGTSGFFAARLVKSAELAGPAAAPPSRDLARAGWQRLGRKAAQALAGLLVEQYGFDLPGLLDRQDLAPWQWGDGIYLLPEALLRHFAGLPVASAGLLLGTGEPGAGFELAHEFAARFAGQCAHGWHTIPEEDVPGWLRGSDASDAPAGMPRGAVVLVRDEAGRFVGLGRVQAGRMKNLLPRRLAAR